MLKRILRKILKKETSLDYCYKLGFVSGENFKCNSPYAIDANYPWLIHIGDNVILASDVKILAHDASTILTGNGSKISDVIIGNNVFVGANSIILCGVHIGNNVIIGAGSVITKDVEDNSVVAGNPARFIMSFESYKNKHDKLRKNSTYFKGKYDWSTWKNATEIEKNEMFDKLKDTYGYI